MELRSDTKLKEWKKFYRLNSYFHDDLEKLASSLIPPEVSLIEFESQGGELLSKLPNKEKLGVSSKPELLKHSQKHYKKIKFLDYASLQKLNKKFDYILLTHTLNDSEDVQKLVSSLNKLSLYNSRVIAVYFNFLWKPIFDVAEKLGLRLPQNKESSWLSEADINNFFYLEGFEKIKSGKRFIMPYKIALISDFINKVVSQIPLINIVCLTNYAIYKPIQFRNDYSVSIIIPARNEAGHMRGVLKKIPKIGKSTEIIFVEGNSSDDTYQVIKDEIANYKGSLKLKLLKQKGKGKGDAVRLGFSYAKNDLLMILDADLTVDPKELIKFYEAAANGKGDLIMGSRLIYPMEKQAMRVLNYLGNKFFSIAFSYLLDQRIKDTLCGTKVLLKSNYEKIASNRIFFGDFDPFGDYDLIFGASKLNLKIVEIPIRYKERVYGKTNISRFTHGFLLLKMVVFAAKKIKFT